MQLKIGNTLAYTLKRYDESKYVSDEVYRVTLTTTDDTTDLDTMFSAIEGNFQGVFSIENEGESKSFSDFTFDGIARNADEDGFIQTRISFNKGGITDGE